MNDVLQILLYVGVLVLSAPVLGGYMARVFEGERLLLSPVLGKVEAAIYRLSGVKPDEEMNWRAYTWALLMFNFFGFLAVLLVQLLQSHLPLNPQKLPSVSWDSAFNTAISFMTNTNWQGYVGETTMSNLTQMLGLTVQNFMSAATGMAVFVALVRGIVRRSGEGIGNFWQDLTRTTLYILLPLSFVLALVLVGQGVIQTFHSNIHIRTLEGAEQTIPLGPVASQVAIKQLGSNGGGFFNANGAHPFENPTPLSNFLEMLAILLIPAASPFMYGKMVKAERQGRVLFAVMFFVWLAGLLISIGAEYSRNPVIGPAALMEGKETRFGIVNSLIWSTATSAGSNGSVNAMHASLSPLAGGVALFNIMMGEVIFGGVGSGMYGLLLFVVMTVFLSGLMVGRSPEYLGKRIEALEMKMATLGILGPCVVILIGAAISVELPVGLSSLLNKGPHGLSEILYAFSSAAGNNGSAFAGLNANTVYYNLMLGITMLIGRFVVIISALAIAGSLVRKRKIPLSAGTFTTDSPLFAVLLVVVILVVGALTFVPSFSLGPVVEHFLMLKSRTF